ncbi:hypothetical protein, partial [Dysosmobacter sp.]|uniref:hypothetical protein n=1 Tax=Dysosmobacter sp. TaxID=2591382 RepID=UPI003AEF5A56
VDKEVDSPQRKGRVCAGNPRRVSCAIEILSFQSFYKVLKTGSAGRKDFFDTLTARQQPGSFCGITRACTALFTYIVNNLKRFRQKVAMLR